MERGDRIRLVQRLRDALSQVLTDDEDLLLNAFEIGERLSDGYGNGPTLTQWLNSAEDDHLVALGQHLELLDNAAGYVSGSPAVTEPEPLFIFATHLSAHRAYLAEVEAELARYSVRVFVAHDSIPMDAEWQKEIVDALNACHAGAAFIHCNLHESYYCMQELGWMLGRGIPIARLMFGESPKGLLADKQGKPLAGRPATEVAAAIVDWSLTHDGLRPHVAASLTAALDNSRRFHDTDMIWDRLTRVPVLTSAQTRRVVHAGETNNQVYGTAVGGYRGRPYSRGPAKSFCDFLTCGYGCTTRR